MSSRRSLLWLLAPTVLAANEANPIRPGAPVGEPAGGLESMVIEREVLRLDLRPLADVKPAIVDATYEIRNLGKKQSVELIFVAGREADGWEVTVDGVRVPVRIAADGAATLPATWRPPRTTPHPWEGEALAYSVAQARTVRFAVTIDTARHTIRVRYAARATMHAGDSPTVFWQLGYVLATARQWAGFHRLETTVLVPAGWRAASRPRLTRDGDTLSGQWNQLPADALSLTIQAPPPSAPLRTVLFPIGLLVVGVGSCLVLGRAAGRWLGRRGRGSVWALPLSLVLAIGWGIGGALLTISLPTAMKAAAGAQASWTYGQGTMFLAILTGPVSFLIALLITQVAVVRGKDRE